MRHGPPIPLRLLFAVAYAVLPATLWALSPFHHLTASLGPLPPWGVAYAASLLLTLGALVPDRPPLPGLLGLATGASVSHAYAVSHLDWSRLLKDWNLADGRGPDPLGLALSATALLAAFAWHLVDQRHRLRAHYAAKGADLRGLRGVRVRLRREGLRLLAHATLALLAAAGLFTLLQPLLARIALSDALLTPLFAGALLLLAALLALPRNRKGSFDG